MDNGRSLNIQKTSLLYEYRSRVKTGLFTGKVSEFTVSIEIQNETSNIRKIPNLIDTTR